MSSRTQRALEMRMIEANKRYGPFASTHEALGVACEEWDEFRAAVQANDFDAIQEEAKDLAAALIRLIDQLTEQEIALRQRSAK